MDLQCIRISGFGGVRGPTRRYICRGTLDCDRDLINFRIVWSKFLPLLEDLSAMR